MEYNASFTVPREVTAEISFPDGAFSHVRDLFFSPTPAKPTHAVMIERQLPMIPREPVKGAPLVGKRYRMARRKYGRRMRRGNLRGWPTETVRQYFGPASITASPETGADGSVSFELTIEQDPR